MYDCLCKLLYCYCLCYHYMLIVLSHVMTYWDKYVQLMNVFVSLYKEKSVWLPDSSPGSCGYYSFSILSIAIVSAFFKCLFSTMTYYICIFCLSMCIGLSCMCPVPNIVLLTLFFSSTSVH